MIARLNSKLEIRMTNQIRNSKFETKREAPHPIPPPEYQGRGIKPSGDPVD
jgi:hypothetical protein